jgi:hypothetical protein
MPVDPTIALQVKPLQLPDPLAQYGNFMAVQRAQQENALAQMKMEQAQREVEQQNNLRQFLPAMRPEDRQQLLGYGQAGRQVYESLLKGDEESRKARKEEADTAAVLIKQSRDLLPSVTTPEAYANWRAYTLKNLPSLSNLIPEQYTPEGVRGLMMEADKALEQHFVTQDLGGGKQVLSMPKYGGGPAAVVPGSAAATLPLPRDVEAQKARIALAGRPPAQPREPAIRTTKVDLADGTIGVMNLDTGEIKPATVGGVTAKGKPSAFAEKSAAQRKQLALDLDRTITELEAAAKPGGLISQSTGSGAGHLVDIGAKFIGQATPGAIAAGKLALIADMALKMVPRFEGPQSDKDTKSYKEAAGQLADSTLPNKIRQEAAKEIVRLMKARKTQFATEDMLTEGAPPPPAGGADLTAERANARAAIAAGAPEAAVRTRFKDKTGQEL